MNNALNILIIYTGGTIGMAKNPETGALTPVDFSKVMEVVPELEKFHLNISALSFEPPLDSSNMNPDSWMSLAFLIKESYAAFDGFVVLHGSDTMAYTASMLSFLLEGLNKPVILTGSQLPIGLRRTDGRENLITAMEIASARKDGRPMISEVCVYFESKLFRGNRCTKHSAARFKAFNSASYPALAEAGIEIIYNEPALLPYRPDSNIHIKSRIESNVVFIKMFPGITQEVIESIANAPGLRGIVLETFGSGNAPSLDWFVNTIKSIIDKGIVILNVSQCETGSVDMSKYETGIELLNAGVISGRDMTSEAAVTKLMYLLGQDIPTEKVRELLDQSLAGEMTI